MVFATSCELYPAPIEMPHKNVVVHVSPPRIMRQAGYKILAIISTWPTPNIRKDIMQTHSH